MFVVTVLFRIKPGHEAEFETEMVKNAKASLTDEPGCRQFDICKGASGEIFLYEIYDDAAAFEDHKVAPHFTAFDTKTAPWVAEKTVWLYEKLA